MRRIHLCRVGLGMGSVGRAEHANGTRTIGEARDPFDGVISIRSVEVVILRERAFGVVPSSHVLKNDNIATFDEIACTVDEAPSRFAIRGSLQQNREWGVDGGAAVTWAIDVGGEMYPVSHRDHGVLGKEHHVMSGRHLGPAWRNPDGECE